VITVVGASVPTVSFIISLTFGWVTKCGLNVDDLRGSSTSGGNSPEC
jgi:hypothetical protein